MKKLLLCLTAIAGWLGQAQAQTNIITTKLEGGPGSTAHVTLTHSSGYGLYVAGWFTDSLELSLDPVGLGSHKIYPHPGANPGAKAGFIAYYNEDAEYVWGLPLSGPNSDSCIITCSAIAMSGEPIFGAVFNGDIVLDPPPYGSGANAASAGVGAFSSFVVCYQNITGALQSAGQFGYNVYLASMTESYGGPFNLVMGGWFTGTTDLDPSLGTYYGSSVGGKDAWMGLYNPSPTGSFNASTSPFTFSNAGTGDEWVDKVKLIYGEIWVAGGFTHDINLDIPLGFALTSSNPGTQDVFLARYNTSLSALADGIQIGDAGIEKVRGLDECSILLEFNGSPDMNPKGPADVITSQGGYDLVLAKYSMFTFEQEWHRHYGSAGDEKASFLYKKQSGEYNFYIGMDFEGTLDIGNASSPTTVTATVNPRNSVVVETDFFGSYIDHYQVEAQKVGGFFVRGTSDNGVVMVGDFSGTSVDVAFGEPYVAESTVANQSLYFSFMNRCRFKANAVLQSSYECGSCTATLFAQYTGAAGTPGIPSWSMAGGMSSNSGYVVYNRCDGEHYLNMSDQHGCYSKDTITLGHPAAAPFDFDVTVTNSTCGNDFGSATATVYNAIGDVHYQWSSGDTLMNADSLYAGIYTLTIMDDMGCYYSESFNVNDADGPSVTLVSTSDLNCGDDTNGAIDISITGGAPPLEIIWSNGATTEDLSGLKAGTYAVLVTDVNGCQGQLCVNLAGPAPMKVELPYYNYSNCLGASGVLSVHIDGGTAPFVYNWSNGETTDSISSLAAGLYVLEVTDANGCTVVDSFGVSDIEGAMAYPMLTIPPSCTATGQIVAGLYSGLPPYASIEWSTGAIGNSTTVTHAGKYFMTVVDDASCVSVLPFEIGQMLPNMPDVCMVTVDETNTKNVIVWDKTTTPDAVSYNIYREGFCNSADFLPIGNVDHDSLSVFEDTVVNTQTRSWRYYVTAIDACGFESVPSIINKTIHLTALAGTGGEAYLSWEAYLGKEIEKYEIFRVDPVDSTLFTLIDSVDGNTLNYTDDDDFSAYVNHDLEWYVEAIPLTPCYASRAFNQNASRSNHTRLGLGVILDTTGTNDLPGIDELIQLYPNPANDRLNIRVSGSEVNYHVVILNSVGQQVGTYDFKRSVSISTAGMNQGVYYVMISNQQKQNKVYKLVVAH